MSKPPIELATFAFYYEPQEKSPLWYKYRHERWVKTQNAQLERTTGYFRAVWGVFILISLSLVLFALKAYIWLVERLTQAFLVTYDTIRQKILPILRQFALRCIGRI